MKWVSADYDKLSRSTTLLIYNTDIFDVRCWKAVLHLAVFSPFWLAVYLGRSLVVCFALIYSLATAYVLKVSNFL